MIEVPWSGSSWKYRGKTAKGYYFDFFMRKPTLINYNSHPTNSDSSTEGWFAYFPLEKMWKYYTQSKAMQDEIGKLQDWGKLEPVGKLEPIITYS